MKDCFMRVSLFIPCLSEHMAAESAMNMVRVLDHLGCEIDYVEDQTCCGQPAFNSGYRKEIVPMAERFINLFKTKEVVISPSGSCAAMVKAFYDDLDLSAQARQDLAALRPKFYEFSEFLVDKLGVQDWPGRFPHRVTYHESCHLSRELGIVDQPRQLIRLIKDIDFVEMQEADTCCGFGGTFSVKYSDVSVAMVQRKCEFIEASGADYCIGCDSSCLMNIEGYLRKHGMNAKTLHLADLLAQSLNL